MTMFAAFNTLLLPPPRGRARARLARTTIVIGTRHRQSPPPRDRAAPRHDHQLAGAADAPVRAIHRSASFSGASAMSVLSAYAHQDLPFDQLVRAIQSTAQPQLYADLPGYCSAFRRYAYAGSARSEHRPVEILNVQQRVIQVRSNNMVICASAGAARRPGHSQQIDYCGARIQPRHL